MTELYARAPVTEAVIELRFADPVGDKALAKAKSRLASRYDKVEDLVEFQFEVVVGAGAPTIKQRPLGVRLTSADAVRVAQIRQNGFSVSRMAPYDGWAPFKARLMDEWAIWSKVVGRRRLDRVGVRFINRIDVPLRADGSGFDHREYLNVEPDYPRIFVQDTRSFNIELIAEVEDQNLGLRFAAGTMDPVLLGHGALALDIDLFRTVDVPDTDSDLWSLLDQIRDVKDQLFEASITDRTRELIR